MKKYLLGLLFIFVTSFSFAGVEKKDSTTVATTVVSAPNATAVYITEKLEKLAESLKVPVEHMFKVFVTREIISSVTSLISYIAAILLSLWLLNFTYKNHNKANADWRKENPGHSETYNYYDAGDGWWIVGYIVSVVVLVIGIIFLLVDMGDIFNGLFNPEYGAYMQILELLK